MFLEDVIMALCTPGKTTLMVTWTDEGRLIGYLGVLDRFDEEQGQRMLYLQNTAGISVRKISKIEHVDGVKNPVLWRR